VHTRGEPGDLPKFVLLNFRDKSLEDKFHGLLYGIRTLISAMVHGLTCVTFESLFTVFMN